MILLNFSHPLSPDQLARVAELTGQQVDRVVSLPAQFDHGQPFVPQLAQLMARLTLTSDEWQTAGILVVPPALNFIAALLLAELHGRMGYFPPLVRLRPAAEALPPRYEVAEILPLQSLRDAARLRRT